MRIRRAIDQHPRSAASGGLSADVDFVTRDSRRLWPELSGSDPWMEIECGGARKLLGAQVT
jgi:hypothetical protein